ncbi:hypothetical protein EON78_07705 [bacterium]|nr:MAG: hypothetical protein EON78_07705 [bacterium]
MKKALFLTVSLFLLNGCYVDSNVNLVKRPSTNASANSNGVINNVPVSQVQAIPDSLVITVGNKVPGTANVIYSDGSRNTDLIWTSSDNTVASVNPTTGEISGVKPGIVTILATAQRDSSKKAAITVSVKRADVTEALTKINPSEATLKIGDTVRLSASIQMSDGTISPNVIWRSDSNSIALVSNGLVTAISEGTTTITAIAEGDSTKTASARITVSNGTTVVTPATPVPTATVTPSPVPTATVTPLPTPTATATATTETTN